MIDHTGLDVSDAARSRRFYEEALAPLGYKVLMEVPLRRSFGEDDPLHAEPVAAWRSRG